MINDKFSAHNYLLNTYSRHDRNLITKCIITRVTFHLNVREMNLKFLSNYGKEILRRFQFGAWTDRGLVPLSCGSNQGQGEPFPPAGRREYLS